MRNLINSFVLLLAGVGLTYGQGLETVPPVLINKLYHKIDTSISFILTPNNVLEIIDAYQPWPPRWFASNGYDKTKGWDSSAVYYENARFQSNRVTFFKNWQLNENSFDEGYIICNKRMEPVDTARRRDLPLNTHDFRINEKGEKLIVVRLDTVLNISSMTGNPGDTAHKALVDVIEIFDSANHLAFRWNAEEKLGVNAVYLDYAWLNSRSSRLGYADWSHANSVSWDFDGNILYGFRHIGVGKISRKDGHVIWHIDRNKMPYIAGSDTLAFYLQHGFEKVADEDGHNRYTLFSNGDSRHPLSYGLEFTVDQQNNALHVVSKKMPSVKVISNVGGNYEIEPNGDYNLSYGGNTDVTTRTRIFFEYSNAKDELYATYRSGRRLMSYGVHLLVEFRPPRPTVTNKDGELIGEGDMNEWIWYELNGADNTIVQQVAYGAVFKPANPGVYCVAGKYGIGWSVSKPFAYKP